MFKTTINILKCDLSGFDRITVYQRSNTLTYDLNYILLSDYIFGIRYLNNTRFVEL